MPTIKVFQYNPYIIRNKLSIICLFFSTLVSIYIYIVWYESNILIALLLLVITYVVNVTSQIYLWSVKKHKKSYLQFEHNLVIVVRNDYMKEYNLEQVKIFTFIPNCLEGIEFDKNNSISSMYFSKRDFQEIKNEILQNKNDVNITKSKSSYEKFVLVYNISLIVLALIILFYLPVFAIGGKIIIFGVIWFFIQGIFDMKKRKNYKLQGYHYAIIIILTIVILSLYQIFLGEPTNMLGLGLNLTNLPKVDF